MLPLMVLPSIVIGPRFAKTPPPTPIAGRAVSCGEVVATDVASSADLDRPAEDRADPAADLDRAVGGSAFAACCEQRSALGAGVGEQLEGRRQHGVSPASRDEGPPDGGVQADADQPAGREGSPRRSSGCCRQTWLWPVTLMPNVSEKLTMPPPSPAPVLPSTWLPSTDRDRPLEVGGDAAAGAVVGVAVDLTAVGDGHAAEQDDDPAAKHPDGLVVVHLAAGNDHIAGHLADPAAAEVARR